MLRRPPRSTRTDTLFPYTTLFRSSSAMMRLIEDRMSSIDGSALTSPILNPTRMGPPSWTIGKRVTCGIRKASVNRRIADRIAHVVHIGALRGRFGGAGADPLRPGNAIQSPDAVAKALGSPA